MKGEYTYKHAKSNGVNEKFFATSIVGRLFTHGDSCHSYVFGSMGVTRNVAKPILRRLMEYGSRSLDSGRCGEAAKFLDSGRKLLRADVYSRYQYRMDSFTQQAAAKFSRLVTSRVFIWCWLPGSSRRLLVYRYPRFFVDYAHSAL